MKKKEKKSKPTNKRKKDENLKKLFRKRIAWDIRDFYISLYRTRMSVFVGRVFVSVCITVPSTKRPVQEHAEVHEHVLHGDVHCWVHTEDRRIRREGKLSHIRQPHPSHRALSKIYSEYYKKKRKKKERESFNYVTPSDRVMWKISTYRDVFDLISFLRFRNLWLAIESSYCRYIQFIVFIAIMKEFTVQAILWWDIYVREKSCITM